LNKNPATSPELFGELDPEPRLLMGPGPVDVYPRVLRAMSVALQGQFDPQFTTYMTQRQMIKKTGWNEDPQQRMIQKFMLYGIPFFTLTSGWYFPIGVIIYWVTNNAITLGQQYWVLHKYPPPVTAGNIPMKSARSAATPDSPGFLARFIQAKPAPPKPTGGSAPTRGFLRRKPDELPPAPEARSLAPKPGAKPVKQTPPPGAAADEPASSNGGTPDSKPKSTS